MLLAARERARAVSSGDSVGPSHGTCDVKPLLCLVIYMKGLSDETPDHGLFLFVRNPLDFIKSAGDPGTQALVVTAGLVV